MHFDREFGSDQLENARYNDRGSLRNALTRPRTLYIIHIYHVIGWIRYRSAAVDVNLAIQITFFSHHS